MSGNLPDDWSCYYTTCPNCGVRYHASGTEECACVPCDDCGETFPPGELERTCGFTLCHVCEEERIIEMQDGERGFYPEDD